MDNIRSHRLYGVWKAMRQRCNNPRNKDYKHYGGRGITICSEWSDYEVFYSFCCPLWEQGLEIDRKDNDRGYTPENCRFVKPVVNRRNTRPDVRSTSKYTGVSFRRGKWVAVINIEGSSKYIGSFSTEERAAMEYNQYIIDFELDIKFNSFGKGL